MRQIEAALKAAGAALSTLDAQNIAVAHRRDDNRWHRQIKPSQQRIWAVEAVLRQIENMASLDEITALAKLHLRPAGKNAAWDKPNVLSYEELKKAEKLMKSWKP